MLIATVNTHTKLKHSHIEKHLYPVILLRLNFTLDGKFISLTRLHFNEATHIALHIVESTLNTQRFTNIRRLQYGIGLIQIIP